MYSSRHKATRTSRGWVHPSAKGVCSLLFSFVPFYGTHLKFNKFITKVSTHPCLLTSLSYGTPSLNRNAQHNKQHNLTSIPCHPILHLPSHQIPLRMPILHPIILTTLPKWMWWLRLVNWLKNSIWSFLHQHNREIETILETSLLTFKMSTSLNIRTPKARQWWNSRL